MRIFNFVQVTKRASAKFYFCRFAAPTLSGAAHLLKNSGASLLMQSCSIFMSSPSDQEVDNNRMLVSEAKAVTSLIGCNISAVSSHLNGGSVTKITGSLIGPPLFSANSCAAFRVNDSGTKLFALGKLHATCNNCNISHDFFPASTALSWPLLATAEEQTRVQLEKVTLIGSDHQIANGVQNHETARVIAKAVVVVKSAQAPRARN